MKFSPTFQTHVTFLQSRYVENKKRMKESIYKIIFTLQQKIGMKISWGLITYVPV